MRWRSIGWLVIAATALAGCATRGSIAIRCDGFKAHPLPASRLVRDIQADAGGPISIFAPHKGDGEAETSPRDPLAASIATMVAAQGQGAEALGQEAPGDAMLLLSGGGQWGAFGAGFLSELARRGGEHKPDFQVLTGVSTGAMQSLFLAIDDPEAYALLERAYLPVDEREIVDRNDTRLAVITGSVAGLKPLRRRIEHTLCGAAGPAAACPLIEQLAASKRQVFIGFVEARTGNFVYADVVALARAGTGPDATEEKRANAQQCLTGVALASAAMPVFFQRVMINGTTYYDGGVRQSVFEAVVAETVESELAKVRQKKPDAEPPPIYVVRNGPTQLLDKEGKPGTNEDADRSADALTAALRAESIVVNQLEVGSIAAIRLSHPSGPLLLATADGYHRSFPGDIAGELHPACEKPEKVMFDRAFMACLQALGRSKARRAEPWLSITSRLPTFRKNPRLEASKPPPSAGSGNSRLFGRSRRHVRIKSRWPVLLPVGPHPQGTCLRGSPRLRPSTPCGVRPRVPLGDGGSRPLRLVPSGMVPDQRRRLQMATIANLTVKDDGSFEGTLATLSVTAPIAIVPNGRKAKDSEPDYRVVSRKNGFELGAGWVRTSQATGAEYVSVSLSAPELGTIYCNIANAPGDDPSKKVLIWNPPG